MIRKRAASVILGASLLTVGGMPAGATGAVPQGSTSSAMACSLRFGSVDAAGNHTGQQVAATRPPTIGSDASTRPVYPPGRVRLSSTFTIDNTPGGAKLNGYVVLGDTMYRSLYQNGLDGLPDPENPPVLQRVGGGWGAFAAFERSDWTDAKFTTSHSTKYGLRADGVLFRWTSGSDGLWHRAGFAGGFAAVKSMALISKTSTYDTFLANTRGGALYTIRIPLGSPMKPVVKQVRSRTWQGFESLIAHKCGSSGTLLLGIDKDTDTGYLYAVGHAIGTATVIQLIGKVPASFADPVFFRWAFAEIDPLNGE
jgi:hypothetical protein